MTFKSMAKNINTTSDTLFLETFLPVVCKCKDTICITIDDINIGLELAVIDLINVEPDLKGTRNTTLTDFFQKSCNDRHIIVNQYNIWFFVTNNIREDIKSESLLRRCIRRHGAFFHVSRIQDTNIGRIGAVVRRELGMFLESKVSDREEGLFGENLYKPIGNFTIPSILVCMCTNKKHF